jgi:subtilisin-like proprotein convertase family protein
LLQANPDGRVQAESGLSWRKNTNQNYCGSTSTNRGVDLNRNFDFQWDCCGGSSGSECSSTYRGPVAASEPETQAVQNYVRRIFPDQRGPNLTDPAPDNATGVYLDIHSYGELVLWPWGFTNTVAPNGTDLQTFGRKLAYFNNYYPEQSIGLYPTDGDSETFAYGDLGVASYTIELGTAFFQSCNVFENTVLPDNLPALLYAAKAARAPYQLPSGPDVTNIALSAGTVLAGTPVTLSADVSDLRFRNSNGTEPTQNINAAEYYLDTPYWDTNGAPTAFSMVATDGNFNAKSEGVTAIIDTTGFADGQHTIYIRGQDASGTWGVVSAIFLNIGTPSPTPTPTNTPTSTPVPDGLFCSSNSVSIPDPGSTNSSQTVTDVRSISDLNVTLDVAHTYVGDLVFTLTHDDSGTSVTIVDRPGVPGSTYGCSGNNINAILDDEASALVENACGGGTPTINGSFIPNNALSAFDGEGVAGSWTMSVTDAVGQDSGVLNEWCLETTLSGPPPTPTSTPIPPTPTNTPEPPTPTPDPGGGTCTSYTSSDVPKAIPNLGSVSSIVTAATGGTVTDVNVLGLQGLHGYVGQLDIYLSNPGGTQVQLLDNVCGSADNFNLNLDDAGTAGIPCPPTDGGTYQPAQALATYNGTSGNGTWTLTVVDSAKGFAGTLTGWSVEICTNGGGNPTPTPAPSPTPSPTPVPGSAGLYVSTSSNGSVDGIDFEDEDVLRYDANTDSWSLHIDGSDVGLAGVDINALALVDDGSLLFSFDAPITLSGAGTVDDSDIVRFIPTSTGPTTAGTWELYFDGSDVGLSSDSEDIDALYLTSGGDLIISVTSFISVPGISKAPGQDLVLFAPSSLGGTTSGTWSMYFDGSDVGLSTSNENIWGTWIDEGSGAIYLTSAGAFSVSGLAGEGADVFTCASAVTGTATSCSGFTLYFDGSATSIAGQSLDALHVVP